MKITLLRIAMDEIRRICKKLWHKNEAIRLLVLANCPFSEYARGYHVEGDLTPHTSHPWRCVISGCSIKHASLRILSEAFSWTTVNHFHPFLHASSFMGWPSSSLLSKVMILFSYCSQRQHHRTIETMSLHHTWASAVLEDCQQLLTSPAVRNLVHKGPTLYSTATSRPRAPISENSMSLHNPWAHGPVQVPGTCGKTGYAPLHGTNICRSKEKSEFRQNFRTLHVLVVPGPVSRVPGHCTMYL